MNPFWPKHNCVFKGFSDFVSLNPVKNLKDSIHQIGQGGNGLMDSPLTILGVGGALRPSNLNNYAKVTLNPSAPAYGYGAKNTPVAATVPAAATPTAQRNAYGAFIAEQIAPPAVSPLQRNPNDLTSVLQNVAARNYSGIS